MRHIGQLEMRQSSLLGILVERQHWEARLATCIVAQAIFVQSGTRCGGAYCGRHRAPFSSPMLEKALSIRLFDALLHVFYSRRRIGPRTLGPWPSPRPAAWGCRKNICPQVTGRVHQSWSTVGRFVGGGTISQQLLSRMIISSINRRSASAFATAFTRIAGLPPSKYAEHAATLQLIKPLLPALGQLPR